MLGLFQPAPVNLTHLVQCCEQFIDVVGGRKKSGTYTDRTVGIGAKGFVGIRRAVQSRPDCDSEGIIQNCSQFLR